MSPLVLVTYCDSIVCYGADKKSLVHIALAGADLNAIFSLSSNGDLFSWRGDNASLVSDMPLNKVEDSFATAIAITDDCEPKIHLYKNSFYACADETGRVTFDREKTYLWEVFQLVPLYKIYEKKLKLLREKTIAFPRWPRQESIPKTVHKIFLDGQSGYTSLPENVDQSIRQLVGLNPGYQLRVWFEKDIIDFIYGNYGFDIFRAYQSINSIYPAARADFFRYLCLYKLGGIYLDLKSTCIVPIDDIIRGDDQFILSQWYNSKCDPPLRNGMHDELQSIDGGEYQQWFIISVPGHPFLEAVIYNVLKKMAEYDHEKDGVGKLGVLRTTGPIIYTLAIDRIRHLHEHRLINAEEEGFVFNSTGGRAGMTVSHYSLMNQPVVL